MDKSNFFFPYMNHFFNNNKTLNFNFNFVLYVKIFFSKFKLNIKETPFSNERNFRPVISKAI